LTMTAHERWRVLIVLTLARIAMGFQFQSVASAMPSYARDLGLSQTDVGWLIGIYLLPGIALALPGGMLGGRWGDKRTVVAGLALMAAGGAAMAFCHGMGAAVVARGLAGIGAIVLNVLLTKMVSDWFTGPDRVFAMSVLVNAWPIGIGLALLTLGPLAAGTSWTAAFLATSLFALAGLVAVLFGYSRAPDAGDLQQVRLSGMRGRELFLCCLAGAPWMFYNAAYALFVAFMPIYFIKTGMTVGQAGGSTALTAVMFIVSVQAGGAIVRRTGRIDLITYVALAGWATSLAGILLTPAPLPWLILGGLLGGLPAGIFVSQPAEVLSPGARATGMGLFYTIYYIGVTAFSPIAGALADFSGSSQAPIWLAGSLVLATAISFAAFRHAARPVSTPGP
jgi:MFS family permease